MTNMSKTKWLGAVTAGLLVLPQVSAVEIIGFDDVDDSQQAGILSYNGAGGPLVGSNIFLDQITYSGSAQVLTIDNGLLNFQTGANISEGPTQWVFGNGGSFTITGTAKDAGNTVVATGTLLSGYFTGAGNPTLQSGAVGPLQNFGLFAGAGLDTKNEDILDFWNVDSVAFAFANTEISTGNFATSGDGSFVANVVNADVDNFGVPDTGMTIILLGTGLVGLGLFRRQK